MALSLSSKLRAFRRTLRPRFKQALIFDSDHLKLISRHMPRTSAELNKYIPIEIVGAYGDKIIELVVEHGRDQDRFEDCILEINAFVRGGLPGMDRLDKVFPQILKHFEMEDDMEEIMEACNLYIAPPQNRLKRKRSVVEDDMDSCPSYSQSS